MILLRVPSKNDVNKKARQNDAALHTWSKQHGHIWRIFLKLIHMTYLFATRTMNFWCTASSRGSTLVNMTTKRRSNLTGPTSSLSNRTGSSMYFDTICTNHHQVTHWAVDTQQRLNLSFQADSGNSAISLHVQLSNFLQKLLKSRKLLDSSRNNIQRSVESLKQYT